MNTNSENTLERDVVRNCITAEDIPLDVQLSKYKIDDVSKDVVANNVHQNIKNRIFWSIKKGKIIRSSLYYHKKN